MIKPGDIVVISNCCRMFVSLHSLDLVQGSEILYPGQLVLAISSPSECQTEYQTYMYDRRRNMVLVYGRVGWVRTNCMCKP